MMVIDDEVVLSGPQHRREYVVFELDLAPLLAEPRPLPSFDFHLRIADAELRRPKPRQGRACQYRISDRVIHASNLVDFQASTAASPLQRLPGSLPQITHNPRFRVQGSGTRKRHRLIWKVRRPELPGGV